jgi:hypothetical protein
MVWLGMIMVCLCVKTSFYKWHQVGFVVGTICWRWVCLKMTIGNKNQFVWWLTCNQIDFKVLEFFFVVVGFCFLKIQISQTWALGYYALPRMINWRIKKTVCHALRITPYTKICGSTVHYLSFIIFFFFLFKRGK